jgi:hypothetical protein
MQLRLHASRKDLPAKTCLLHAHEHALVMDPRHAW